MINPALGFYLKKYFEREGFAVRLAVNGFEALREIKREQPDCVLLDMKMNGIDGIDVLKVIRKDYPKTHVFMMTAYNELELTNQALELGAAKYFTKPFDIFEVRDAVNDLFEN